MNTDKSPVPSQFLSCLAVALYALAILGASQGNWRVLSAALLSAVPLFVISMIIHPGKTP